MLLSIPALRYRTAAVLVAAFCLVWVFVRPWFRPAQVLEIVSESQAVGFNNRIALFSLVASVLVLAVLGLGWARAERGTRSRTASSACVRTYAEDGVPLWIVIAALIGVLVETVLIMIAFRGAAYSDSAYFIDRLHYIANGSRLGVDFEYSYGLLLIWPAYAMWLLLRDVGASISQCYFVFVGLMHMVGLVVTAWIINRLDIPRVLKAVWFSVIAVVVLAVVTFGVNYTPLRFMAPALAVLLVSRSPTAGLKTALLAVCSVAVSFLLSPEVGMVATIGVATMLFFEGLGEARVNWAIAALVLALGVTGWRVGGLAAGSTGGAIKSGAYYLPLLPALPAIVLIASALLVGWLLGVEVARIGWHRNAVVLGWFAAAVSFLPAAMGRADVIHLFWNGLMLMLLASVLAWRFSPLAGGALTAAATSALAVSVIGFALAGLLAPAYGAAVRGGAITFDDSRRLAVALRRTDNIGRRWFRAAWIAPMKTDDVRRLAVEGRVFAPFWLCGDGAEILVRQRALVPSFGPPMYLVSRDQLDITMAQMLRATSMVLPEGEYRAYLDRARAHDSVGPACMVMAPETDGLNFAVITGFPLRVRPTRPVFDPTLKFGRELGLHWRIVKRSGGYVILRRAKLPAHFPE